MGYRCVVLAKQVPDTKNITGQAMKDDGTVNRAALPAIFNPEDLHALEAALDIKSEYGGSVTVITMGPPSACELLRQSLARGADRAILLTDRKFAAADTLATSYALSEAVNKLGGCDILLCGRQAIDGDTAQTGPQTAQKLGLPQIAYVQELLALEDGRARARRQIEGGYEILEEKLPALLTITDEMNEPSPPRAKLLLKYRYASSRSEIAGKVRREMEDANLTPDPEEANRKADRIASELEKKGLLIEEWNVEDLGCAPERCGGAGSPTKVKKIDSVVLSSHDLEMIEPDEKGIRELVAELARNHILD